METLHHSNQKVISRIFISLFIFLFTGVTLNAQKNASSDRNTDMNRLLFFLAEFENTLNSDSTNKTEKLLNFFYNPNVEVFNDFSSSYLDNRYVTAKFYTDQFEKQDKKYFYFHKGLELVKKNNQGYYDIIILKVKQQKIYCPDTLIVEPTKYYYYDRISDSATIENELTFNIIYYKYRDKNRLFILKIEKTGESMVSDAWYKTLIPDEVRVEYSSFLTSLKSQNNLDFDKTLKPGYSFTLLSENRISGGKMHALSLFGGLGYTTMNNNWKVGQYDTVINDIDKDEESYRKVIHAENIDQNVDFRFFKIPVGISYRLFPLKRLNFMINAGVDLWWLNGIKYSLNSGTANYSGIYTYDNHEFNISNIPEYGFGTYIGQPTNVFSFSDFGVSFTFSGLLGLKIMNNLDLYIGPYYNLTNMPTKKEAPEVLTKESGYIVPVAEVLEKSAFTNSGFTFGARFRLNNIDKPYLKSVPFMGDAHKEGKQSYFRSFTTDGENIPFDSITNTRTIRLKIHANSLDVNDIDYVKYYKYREVTLKSGATDSKLIFGKIHFNKAKKIKLKPGQKLYLVKPFGYDLYASKETQQAQDFEIRIDTIKTLTPELKLEKLNPLHIFVTTRKKALELNEEEELALNAKMNAMADTFLTRMNQSKNEFCIHYIHGDRIGIDLQKIYEESESLTCNLCRNLHDSLANSEALNRTNNFGSDIFPPPRDQEEGTNYNFLIELRTKYNKYFMHDRRKIFLHIFTIDSSDFEDIFVNLFGNTEIQEGQSANENFNNYIKYIQKYPLNINQFENIYFYSNFESVFSKIDPMQIAVFDDELTKMLFLNIYINSIIFKKTFNQAEYNFIQFRNFKFRNVE